MPKAAVYSSSWDSLGGGERYASAIARLLLDSGYQVDVWWKTNLSAQILDRFDINLSQVNFIDYSPTKASFSTRLVTSSKYDFVFWVSDGSIPLSLAKKTLIHYQIPFNGRLPGSLSNIVKAHLYLAVCNSYFTKKIIDKTYSLNSQVIYPPVDVASFTPLKKTNTIVSIARFSTLLHAKRQDTLIEAFSRICKDLPDWEFVLAGGAIDPEYVNALKKQAKNLSIRIVTNPSLPQIKSLLGQAKIFWSATGFDVDTARHPEKVEHFGITVVEAMAAGVVPIVTNAGGHQETVLNGQTGFLWTNLDELMTYTLQLVKDNKRLELIGKQASVRSKLFSTEIFNANFKKII